MPGTKQPVCSKLVSTDWDVISECCSNIKQQIVERELKIDSIVGLSRGGLVPATILAHMLSVRKVLVHGYHSYDDQTHKRCNENPHGVMYQDVAWDLSFSAGGDLLIVDDLCDQGITMKGLVKRLEDKLTDSDTNFHTAALFCKTRSVFLPDFIGMTCGDEWIAFPWETPN